jgi:mono/diheme cytochrome c family protein
MRRQTRRNRVVVLTAVSLISVAAFFGCSTGKGTVTPSTQFRLIGDTSSEVRCDPTPERLARGRYIVEGPGHCFMCHSDVEWNKPGAPYVPEKKGAGHNWADHGLPFLTSPNLTPDADTGAGAFTDMQFARAIREGVGHDGRRLFPLMPYQFFKKMSDADLASVVVYLRSLKPIHNELPKTSLPEEIRKSLPPVEHVTQPVSEPDQSDPVKRGEYLVALGNCASCHTPHDKTGAPISSLYLAGGEKLKGPWGDVTSPNLTSHASGISYYDEQQFISTIRTGQVKARKLNSIMPWGYFKNMTDDDLRSIFVYLRSLKPVKHTVDNTETATSCRLCGGNHGFGDRN